MGKVFIYCPAQLQTGGPEALHSLAAKLRAAGVEAYLVYYHHNSPDYRIPPDFNPVHPAYAPLQLPYCAEAEDRPGHVVVLPEVVPEWAAQFRQARPVIWWLSVDNYLASFTAPDGGIDPYRFGADPRVWHLAQSEYARRFLLEGLKIPAERVLMLRDYLHRRFLAEPPASAAHRLPFVFFNPAKGWDFTQKLIGLEQQTRQEGREDVPFFLWLPLQGYSPEQCARLLRLGMVYIDFGGHPGMDRLPREAAVSGCCVLTWRKGSAAFAEDVPLPPPYNMSSDQAEDMPAIINLIDDCIARYDEHAAAFAPYRAWISGQEARFTRDAARAFSYLLERPLPEPEAEAIDETRFSRLTELLTTTMEALVYAGRQWAAGDREAGLDMLAQARTALSAVWTASGRLQADMLAGERAE
ncbi:MAG: hypothetical protein LBS10_09105 [Gracilibacteraceae bacterium]|nr:hypothetical protein [Gracilibacteraceae bacterium]